jgi:heme/copper-type cytochrome/quinol oxidase subunit 1
MFSSDNDFIMIFGILIGLGFIAGAVYWVNKLFASNTKDLLVRFVLVIFTSLVALFIVDKTVAFKIHLLDEGMDVQLFDLIKTLTLMIFSYYFGTKNSQKEDKE